MSDRTVLVTDGQLRSALAVVRSLGRRNVDVVCGESSRIVTSSFSRYVSDSVRYPSPVDDPDGFLAFLTDYLASTDVDAVVPVHHVTTKLLSEHKPELERYTNLPVPDYEVFARGWNKAETFRAARRANVPRPRTAQPESEEAARDVAADIGFPVVVKPPDGYGSVGVRFVRSADEFDSAYADVRSDHPNPLVQERIPREGRGMGVGLFYDRDGELRGQFAYQRLREYPPSGGPSTLRESIDREDLLYYGRELLDEMGWTGVAMVEFKLDPRDGTPKLMEVNPRFWGSLHLPYYAGVDFPWLAYRHALGKQPEPALEYDVGVRCRFLLPGDILYLLSKRDRQAVAEFFPLVADDLYYDIPTRDDPLPVLGRLLAMGRFAFSPRMWKRVVFRNST